MKVPSVLILGATSAIAQGAAHAFAKRGYPLILTGRNEEALQRLASDYQIRYGVATTTLHFDADHPDTHASFLDKVVKQTPHLGGVLIAFGDLGDQKEGEKHFSGAATILQRNFTGACSILTYLANHFEKEKRGFIIGISSVAADRGRQSNYIYGAAKGGFALFLQGLRNRLHSSGVRVLTIKPGFVDTPMTFGKEGMFLVADPNDVGEKIVAALDKRSDIVYLPWFWRYIMAIIKIVPEGLFKRLKL